MGQRQQGQDSRALIVALQPSCASIALLKAIRQDLGDILAEFRIPAVDVRGGREALRDALTGDGLRLVISADILNPGPHVLSGMLEPLEEFEAVAGPAFEGGIYALAFADGVCSLREEADELAAVLCSPSFTLDGVNDVLMRFTEGWFCQAPWYRAAAPGSIGFARDHMRALEASGDDEATALRTMQALQAFTVQAPFKVPGNA